MGTPDLVVTTAAAFDSPGDREALAAAVAKYYDDPLGFVMFCYPWSRGVLEEFDGPDVWQTEVLDSIGQQLRSGIHLIRIAVASGHNIGKTAVVAWLVHWFMSTRASPQCVVTANTKQQLDSKTWRELSKWQDLAINGHWFTWSATTYKFKERPRTWFASAIPWSKENSQAFAGTHEQRSGVLMLFDEASTIDDIIWEVAEGAMDVGSIWVVIGNPTDNSGRFYEVFHGNISKRWTRFNVDSRTAKVSNKALIQELLEDYGEDSDLFRVRVMGQFPKVGPTQFIGTDVVDQAMARDREKEFVPPTMPKIMGLDVARHGDDTSVLIRRLSRRMLPEINRWNVPDLMELTGYVAEQMDLWHPDHLYVDVVGMGWGVHDRLIQLGYDNIIAVDAGKRPIGLDKDKYYRLRDQMWSNMKNWLSNADIPQDRQLKTDLIGPQYGFGTNLELRLERKETMKARGMASPDTAEALAVTFAYPAPDRSEGQTAEDLEPEYP